MVLVRWFMYLKICVEYQNCPEMTKNKAVLLDHEFGVASAAEESLFPVMQRRE